MMGKSPKKILVVEDDKPTSDAIILKLNEKGFGTEAAFDGEEAAEKMKNNKYDLVLLDILLPKKNGLEIIEELKQSENLKNIKILIFSNLNHAESIRWAMNCGIEGYVIKADTDINKLVNRIMEILSRA